MPTVLVLDANPDAPMQLRALLGKLNTVIFESAHVEFALELLRRGTIATVIVGERLLGAHSAFDAIRLLRERAPGLTIIFRGSEATKPHFSDALAAGAESALLDTDAAGLTEAVGKALQAA